jgi:hypothetical protein
VKKTAVYTMKRDGWNDFFELHVCPNSKSLKVYAERFYKYNGWVLPEEGLCGTLGLVHPEIEPKINKPYAHVFLSKENIGVGIVTHEALHLAMAHERFILRFGMNYGDGIENLDDEERLAYYLTSAIRGIYDILYDNGHIKPDSRGNK